MIAHLPIHICRNDRDMAYSYNIISLSYRWLCGKVQQ